MIRGAGNLMLSLICPRNAFRTFSSTGTAIFVIRSPTQSRILGYFSQSRHRRWIAQRVHSMHNTLYVACVLSLAQGTHTLDLFISRLSVSFAIIFLLRWSDASGRFVGIKWKETIMKDVKVKAGARTGKRGQNFAIARNQRIFYRFNIFHRLSALQPNRSVYESSISLNLFRLFLRLPFACVVSVVISL